MAALCFCRSIPFSFPQVDQQRFVNLTLFVPKRIKSQFSQIVKLSQNSPSTASPLPPSICLCSGAQGWEEFTAIRLHNPLPAPVISPGSDSGRGSRLSGGLDQLGQQDQRGYAECRCSGQKNIKCLVYQNWCKLNLGIRFLMATLQQPSGFFNYHLL